MVTNSLVTKDANDDLDIVWPSDDERARLERILGPYYRATNSMVVSDAAATRILGEAAARVVRIDQATRAAIQAQLQLGELRGYSTWQIAHGVEADGYRGIDGLFQETWRGRADTVARTELQHASVVASHERFVASGVVDRVRIIDGDEWDLVCARRNGKIVPLDQAPELGHPNCTLVLVPILRQDAEEPSQPQRVFGDWQTLEQAQQQAGERYPNIQWDFTGAKLETIDPTLRQFDKLAQVYPQVAERLQYVGTYRGSAAPSFGAPGEDWGPNTWAHATRDGKVIGINPAFYGDLKKFTESLHRSEATGWHPKGTSSIESVITHEFGHQVENWLRSVDGKIAAQPYVNISGNGLVQDTFSRWYEKHDPSNLSDYAAASKEEGWAESFAANHHSPATVRRRKYVQLQRELLEALNPKNWRHEEGLVEQLTSIDSWIRTVEGTPAGEAIARQFERDKLRLSSTPAGTWRFIRDLPQNERASASEQLNAWLRNLDL
jgi:hypothetical protein